MRLLACGWTKPGDQFRRVDDAAWWKKQYAHPLWEPLGTWLDLLSKREQEPPLGWDEDIAAGKPQALSAALARVNEDLSELRRTGMDVCAPWFIPKRRGALPEPNVVCQARLGLEKNKDKVDDLKDRLAPPIPWWVWGILGLVVARALHKR